MACNFELIKDFILVGGCTYDRSQSDTVHGITDTQYPQWKVSPLKMFKWDVTCCSDCVR